MDEFTKSMFTSLGFDGENLPKSIVETFKKFKKTKDLLQPGRLSAEGYATVVMLSDLQQPVKKKRKSPVAKVAVAEVAEDKKEEAAPWKA